MKKTKFLSLLLALMLVSGIIFAVPVSASARDVTFIVSPSNASVTLNGVTKQASGGAVTFDIADGTYDCLVAATGYIWQQGNLTVSGDTSYSVTLAQDTANSYWTFDNDVEGWTSNKTEDTVTQSDGALVITMTTNDPGTTKKDINLDLTDRDKIYLTYKKTTAQSDMRLYYKIKSGNLYAYTKSLPTTDVYTTAVFENDTNFTGTLEYLRVDPIPSASGLSNAVFYIDKLEIPLITSLTLEKTATVKFNVSPADAEVTFNGVTQQAQDGIAVFPAANGDYDCIVSKAGYVWQEGTVTVDGDNEFYVYLQPDSQKAYWTFDESLEGWASSKPDADVISISEGALKLEMSSSDPYIGVGSLSINMDGRDRVALTYKKTAATEADLLMYYATVIDGTSYGFAEARALRKTLPAETTGFVTEIIEKNEYFAGTLSNFRIDPIPTASGLTGATFYIDKVEIPKVQPLETEKKKSLTFSVSPINSGIYLYDESGELVGEQRTVDGTATFDIDAGNYTYTVKKFGYENYNGSVSVEEDLTLPAISLTPADNYFYYDFTQAASVEQAIADGWNISLPQNLVIDNNFGIQTSNPTATNTFSYMLDETIDHGTIEVTLEVMGKTASRGGYFDATLRSTTPNTQGFSYYVAGSEGDHFKYKPLNENTQLVSERINFKDSIHTLTFVIDLDTNSLKIKHDGEDMVKYATYGSDTAGNAFSGLYMHFKAGCEFYWKSLKVSHSDEVVPTSEESRWIDCEPEPGEFSLVVLPDTQILPKNSPETLSLMAQWILKNKEKENLQYVIHVGDVCGNSEEIEWANWKKTFNIIDGEVPIAVAPGNHDYDFPDPWNGAADGVEVVFRPTDRFNDTFPYEKMSAYPTFGGAYEEGKSDSLYHFFRVGDKKYMILTLEFAPRDSVLEWANEVIAQHPDHNVIIVTHSYLLPLGYREDLTYSYPVTGYHFVRNEEDDCNSGQQVWDKLIKKHENVFLVLGGHSCPNDVARRVDYGDNGNVIHQITVDSTQLDRGNFSYSKYAGMMLQMRFKENGTKIDCNYYSAGYNKYYRENNQFTIEVPSEQLIHDDSMSIEYYIDGEKAEMSSLYKNEYILNEGDVSVVAENPEKNTVVAATYENGKLTNFKSTNDETVNITVPATANSILKTFVWNDFSGISPLEKFYTLARDGYAMVTVSGTEEATARMKNTLTGKTYYNLSAVPYGLYEYTVEKENYVSKTGYISVTEDCTIEAELTPDDTKHTFSFADSGDGFDTLSEGATADYTENGVILELQDGAYIENNSLSLDLENRSKMVLTYKNSAKSTKLLIQYRVEGSDLWGAHQATVFGYCDDFVTTEIDLKNAAFFEGTLTGLRIGLITDSEEPAQLELKSLELIAEDEYNYEGNNLQLKCNVEGATITLTSSETGRKYEQISGSADSIVDFGKLMRGVYDYVIYKPGYSVQMGTITLNNDTPVLNVTLTADSQPEAYRWDFHNSLEQFTGFNEKTTSIANANDCLVITSTGVDPYAFTQNMTAKEIGNRKMLVMRYRNDSPYTRFDVYFVTSESGGYKSLRSTLQPTMLGFDNVYIDFTDVAEWNGSLNILRLDPDGKTGMNPANLYIDSIEMVSVSTVNY